MPPELLLIRHGESEANAGFPCEADCSLTSTGLEQARQRARQLNHDLTEFIGISSPYRRAIQTAAEITKATGIAFAVDEAVREWAGPAMVNGKQYPAESGEQLIERLQDFLRRHEGKKVLIVSHAAPMAVLIQLASGQMPDTTERFWAGIDNCCLRRVRTT